MQNSYFWHQLHLYRKQIIFTVFLLSALTFYPEVHAQTQKHGKQINNPDSDDKWLNYGFTLGGHFSRFKSNYSNQFLGAAQDTVYSIDPKRSPGFSLGFILNLRLTDHLDLRMLPTVGFYEQRIMYDLANGESIQPVLDYTNIELPLLLKYKSARRGNSRMYFVGGITPSYEASNRNRQDGGGGGDRLVTNGRDIAIEYGFGLDLYYPYFKFSPEIRFSHGLLNQLPAGDNQYTQGLDRLTFHSVSIYFMFSD